MHHHHRSLRWATLLAGILACLSGTGCGAEPAPDAAAFREQARERIGRGLYFEAQTAYERSLAAALDAADCRGATLAVMGIGETAYELGDEEVLIRTEQRLNDAFYQNPDCLVEAAVCLARERAAVGGFLDVARGRVHDGFASLYLRRALALHQTGPKATVVAVPATTHPAENPSLWEAGEWHRLVRSDQVRAGGHTWKGVGDGRAEFQAAEFDGWLYFFIRVRDDERRPGDKVELLVDAAVESGHFFARVPFGAKQLRRITLAPGVSGNRAAVEGIDGAWQRTSLSDTGYEILFASPVASLVQDGKLPEQRYYALDLMLTDQDSEGEATVMRWWGLDSEPENLFLAGILRRP